MLLYYYFNIMLIHIILWIHCTSIDRYKTIKCISMTNNNLPKGRCIIYYYVSIQSEFKKKKKVVGRFSIIFLSISKKLIGIKSIIGTGEFKQLIKHGLYVYSKQCTSTNIEYIQYLPCTYYIPIVCSLWCFVINKKLLSKTHFKYFFYSEKYSILNNFKWKNSIVYIFINFFFFLIIENSVFGKF